MGSLPHELSLNFRPKTIADFFREVSMIGNVADRATKLNDFIKSLEDEIRKIDVFKRELPLSMILLNDAILAVKEESMQCLVSKTQPVLEEFIPLKKELVEEEEDNFRKGKNYRDQKKNWMSSVQLWNFDDHKLDSKFETKRNEKGGPIVTQVSLQSCRNKNVERSFVPFKPYSLFPSAMAVRKDYKEEFPIHGLSLCTPGIRKPIEQSASSGSRSSENRAVSSSTLTAPVNLQSGMHQQSSRKQRRCWSPELHRRFVGALQQLGGSQVATPKQIRELMQVEGLTNDEVKSHLQKYRLHTRRVPASTVAPKNQSVVVLGGLLVSQDQYSDSSKACSSQSGSPQGPLLVARTQRTSTTGGDSMEDEDDVKSERVTAERAEVKNLEMKMHKKSFPTMNFENKKIYIHGK